MYFVIDGVFRGEFSGLELFPLGHPDFAVWQLVTSMFMHGSVMHLLFNMLALWSFGLWLERVWGGQRFLIFFLICGVGAGAISLWVNQYLLQAAYENLLVLGADARDLERLVNFGQITDRLLSVSSEAQLRELYLLENAPMVGASGAIYGILVAFAMMFPNFKLALIFLPIPIAAKIFVPVLIGIDLLAGFTGFSIFGLNIAHFAHVGGALVGFLLVNFWLRRSRA